MTSRRISNSFSRLQILSRAHISANKLAADSRVWMDLLHMQYQPQNVISFSYSNSK